MKHFLLLLLLLQSYPPYPPPERTAGIELLANDPHNDNWYVMSHCVMQYQVCRVFFKPGTYYLRAPVAIPSGITHAYFTNVTLIPCAAMTSAVRLQDTLGPVPNITQVHDLNVNLESPPCGTFKPPLQGPTSYH